MLRTISIMNEEWDHLIVLDACRYDYFSMLYKDYFQGKLERVCSCASTTDEWCFKSFKDNYKDVVYVSANPYINSKAKVREFCARNHFFRVIDAWDYCWDDELGTVHPKKVNEVVHSFKDKYVDKRLIIHYLQPHSPYLIFSPSAAFLRDIPKEVRDVTKSGDIARVRKTEIVDKSVRILAFLAEKAGLARSWEHGGRHRALRWKIRELLNLRPETYVDDVRRKIGDIGLRKAYMENLKIVLAYVKKLVETLSGTIIVTADHGELLGEDGCYLHFRESTNPFLREIPWLKIAKEEERKKFEEKIRIIKKIRRLKALSLV